MYRFVALLVFAGVCSSFAPAPASAAPSGQTRSGSLRSRFIGSRTNCTASPSGSGILSDGDFSQAQYPGNFETFSAHQKFAPRWTASGTSIDFAGSVFNTPGGLCSVDLDGTPGPGGIKHGEITTVSGTMYTVSFLLSGNGACGGQIERMEVKAAGQSGQFTWDTSNGNDAQHGIFQTMTWTFTANAERSTLAFETKQSGSCGPVVAAIAVIPGT